MDRNFILPIAVATAIHSLIFISDGPSSRPPAPPRPVDTSNWIEAILPPIDTSDLVPADGEGRKPTEAPPPPVSMENLTPYPKADDFIQEAKLQDLRPRPASDLTSIGSGWEEAVKSAANPGGQLIFGPDLLDNTPNARFQPAPAYPHDLKSSAMEGRVTVAFSVDVNGDVFDARVSNANHVRFGEEALRAVRRWRFEPGLKDGKRVAFRMVQTFTFTLGG